MFDFQNWSRQVYHFIDELERCRKEDNRDKAILYETELRNLWEEMMRSEDDFNVRFLRRLMKATKEVMDGKLCQAQLEKMVDEMREQALKHTEG